MGTSATLAHVGRPALRTIFGRAARLAQVTREGGPPCLALPRLSGEEDGQGDSHAESQAGGQGRSLHRLAVERSKNCRREPAATRPQRGWDSSDKTGSESSITRSPEFVGGPARCKALHILAGIQ